MSLNRASSRPPLVAFSSPVIHIIREYNLKFSVSDIESSKLKQQDKNNVANLHPTRVRSTNFARCHAWVNHDVVLELGDAELKLLLSVLNLELWKSRRHGSVLVVVVHDLNEKRERKQNEAVVKRQINRIQRAVLKDKRILYSSLKRNKQTNKHVKKRNNNKNKETKKMYTNFKRS